MGFGDQPKDLNIYKEQGFEYQSSDGDFDYYDNRKKMIRVGVCMRASLLCVESIHPIRKRFRSGKRQVGQLKYPSEAIVKEILTQLAK